MDEMVLGALRGVDAARADDARLQPPRSRAAGPGEVTAIGAGLRANRRRGLAPPTDFRRLTDSGLERGNRAPP